MVEIAAAQERPPKGVPWHTRTWVTLVGMYLFLPFGLYHMWRYRSWPPWLKWFNTLFGPLFAAVSGYITSRYIWPRVF